MNSLRYSFIILMVSLKLIVTEPPFDNCSCWRSILTCSPRYQRYRYEQVRSYQRRGNQQGSAYNASAHGSARSGEGEGGLSSPGDAVPHIDVQRLCPNATEVRLRGLSLRRFPDGLQDVSIIGASSNSLTALPDPSLLGPRTTQLDLSVNEIAGAGDELRALGALEELRLGWNRLPHLRFLPSPCALRFLDARVNLVASVEGPLRQCSQMRTLLLFAANLTALPDDAFSGMLQMRQMILYSNPIESLSERAFRGLPALVTLDLRYTLLTKLPNRVFVELQSLKTLKLDDNKFDQIPEQAFAGLVELRSLLLSQALRNITLLPEGLFSPLVNLRELYLDHNCLASFPKNLFQQLKHLEELHLEDNSLQTIPTGAFTTLGNLKTLRLQRNNLNDSLPEQVFLGLTKLRSLFLTRAFGNATTLPESLFSPLVNLRELYLDSNGFTSLPRNLFERLTSLEELHLERNSLQAISEGAFSSLTNLKTLRLDHNELTALSGALFSGLRSLRAADASNNWLTALPDLGACCPALESASFYNNSVSAAAETATRSLLDRSGSLSVNLRGNPVRPSTLRWLLRATEAVTYSQVGACNCGILHLRRAALSFCADVACGSHAAFPDWVAAMRASNDGGPGSP